MKKAFSSIIAIVLFALALNSCDNFMNSSGEFREKIADEVAISKASSVNVSVIAKAGTVRIMRLTEKQFCNMGLYQAEEDYQESIVGINDYIMLY